MLKLENDINLLLFVAFNEGVRGENKVIEFKQIFPSGKQIKIAEIIASLSNTESGILFFGWDQGKLFFHDVNIEVTEQQITQALKKINPPLETNILKIKHQIGDFLVVFVPKDGELHSVEEKTPFRLGSHLTYLNASHIVKRDQELKKSSKGYLYEEILLKKYIEGFNKLENVFLTYLLLIKLQVFLNTNQDLLINLVKTWEINFYSWQMEYPLIQSKRINFRTWKPQKLSSYVVEGLELCNNVCSSLRSVEISQGEYDGIIMLLQDTSYREAIKESDRTNHRRCLTTYLKQLNPWNFTDWKFLIEPYEGNKLRLYYQQGSQERTKNLREVDIEIYSNNDKPPTQMIEQAIFERVLIRYQNSIRTLLDKINNEITIIVTNLKGQLIN